MCFFFSFVSEFSIPSDRTVWEVWENFRLILKKKKKKGKAATVLESVLSLPRTELLASGVSRSRQVIRALERLLLCSLDK